MHWEDINTRDVVRWEGDTAIVAHGSKMTELSCSVRVDRNVIDRAEASFGIPESWTMISYSDEADLLRQQADLRRKSALRGIAMDKEGSVFRVDYAWVVAHSTQDLRDTATRIRAAARSSGYRTRRELVGALASFVQVLEYRIPPDRRVDDEGVRVLTAGATMPVATLAQGWGDCDTKSLLFASLVRSIDLAEVCFITMDDHLFGAVRMRPSEGDHAIRHNGAQWVLVELSDAWPLGHVPLDHWNAIVQGTYSVVDLD